MTLANHLKSLKDNELEDLLAKLDSQSVALLKGQASPPSVSKGDLQSAKKGVADSDFIQKIYTFLLLCLEIFKAGLACFLVLLVPMTCGSPGQALHVCTNADLQKSYLYIFTLFWNYVTFIILMLHYVAIWYRERFLIEYFDQDSSVPKNNLVTVLPDYPSISTYFYFHHRLATLTTTLFLVSAILNMVLSAMVSYYHNPSSQSITVFLSNSLLIFSILSRSITASIYNTKAISMVQIEMIEFNQIDADHLGDRGVVLETVPWFIRLLDGGGKLKAE